jgi:hypothetical protein
MSFDVVQRLAFLAVNRPHSAQASKPGWDREIFGLLFQTAIPPSSETPSAGSSVPDIESHLLDHDDEVYPRRKGLLNLLIIGSLPGLPVVPSNSTGRRTEATRATPATPTTISIGSHGVDLRCAAGVSAQEPRILRSFRCLQCLPRKEGTVGAVESRNGGKYRQGYVTARETTWC